MPEDEVMTEAEAFAEFVENREAFMLLAKAKSKGYKIELGFTPEDNDQSIFQVDFHELTWDVTSARTWKHIGFGLGTSLVTALREAFKNVAIAAPSPQLTNAVNSQVSCSAADVNNHPVPGLKVTFTILKPEVIMVTAMIGQTSDATEDWEPEYGIGVFVDGILQGQSMTCGKQPPGAIITHAVQCAASIPAGAHTVEVFYAHRPNVEFGKCKVFGDVNVPATLAVIW